MRATPHPKFMDKNPHAKHPFTFSHQSSKLSLEQYEMVRVKLRQSIKLPTAVPEARTEIIRLLRSPDFKPRRLPRIVWLTAEQWWCVSSALRDWDVSEGYATPEYTIMINAMHRPTTKRRRTK